MSERTDMVQPALVAQLKDTSRELSPLYEYSSFRRISHQSVSSVSPYGTWLCVYQHILQISKGKFCLKHCILQVLTRCKTFKLGCYLIIYQVYWFWAWFPFFNCKMWHYKFLINDCMYCSRKNKRKGILDDKLIMQVWQVELDSLQKLK